MIITGLGGEIERGEVCDLVALHCEVGMVAGLVSKRASTETPRSWIINDIERPIDIGRWLVIECNP